MCPFKVGERVKIKTNKIKDLRPDTVRQLARSRINIDTEYKILSIDHFMENDWTLSFGLPGEDIWMSSLDAVLVKPKPRRNLPSWF